MNTDISDEAAVEFSKRSAVGNFGHICMLDGWRECRSRAEVLIEEREREAFVAGWMAALYQHAGLLISHGVTDWSIQFDAAYRAFKEQNK